MPPRRLPAVLAVIAITGTGCAIPIAQKPSISRETTLQEADAVRASPKTRAEVHELLGEPWIVSDRWRVEVYRTQGKQRLWMLIMAPWPVPMPMPSEKLQAYTLVSYSPDGTTDAIDAGYVNATERGAVLLRAGDFTWTHDGRGTDALTVSLDRFLKDRSPPDGKEALLLLGCPPVTAATVSSGVPGPLCWSGVQIDDGPAEEFPVQMFTFAPLRPRGDGGSPTTDLTTEACLARGDTAQYGICASWHASIVPLPLPAGAHRVRLSNRATAEDVVGTVPDPAWPLTFAVETGSLVPPAKGERPSKPHGEAGAVQFSAELPPALRGQPVLLNSQGRWLAAARPDGPAR